MPSKLTVSNTSCLIALETISRLDLLQQIYQQILIPPAVVNEWGMVTPHWLKVQAIHNQALAQALHLQLGSGEAEAITQAVEISASRLILDDHRARRIAKSFQVPVTGTIGIILRGKQQGLLPLVRPVLEELRTAGLWMSDGLYQQAIQLAGE